MTDRKLWAVKIPADTDKSMIAYFDPPANTYDLIKEAVNDAWFACVHCPSGDDVFVDDEGLLKQLPTNIRLMHLTKYPGPLVGDGIILGPIDGNGDHTNPLTQAAVERICSWSESISNELQG